MLRTNLEFTEAFDLLKKGLPIKRKEWRGYWVWDNQRKTVMMHCKDSNILDIRETEDVLFTLDNIASSDWELATESNCSVLKREIGNEQLMKAA